jgi:predicted ATPase
MRSSVISAFIALLINSPEERQQTLDAVSPSNDRLYEFYSAIQYQIGQLSTSPVQ